MATELIDLKIDFGFKLIFGREGQEPVLAAFLNAILKPPAGKQIQSLTYMNTELTKEHAGDKKSSLDIRAVTEEKQHFNIEIQLKNEHNMARRTLYYWSEMYSRQMQESMAYDELNPTITINILNFNCLQETEEFHSAFHLYEQKKKFLLTDALALHFIEMPKLRRKWRAREVTPRQDKLVRWLLLLDGSEDEEIRQQLEVIAMEDAMLNRALKDWEKASADPKLRELYFDRRKVVLDELAAIRAAGLREQKALEKGLTEGRVEGRVEGKADAICQYLDARFGAESKPIQEIVLTITELDTLTHIINHIFTVSDIDEVIKLVQNARDKGT